MIIKIFSYLAIMRYFWLLVLGLTFSSCTHFDEELVFESETEERHDEGWWEAQRVESLMAEAVWHEDTEQWLRPQNDPFRLENMQMAYDNLVTGKNKIPFVETLDWNRPADGGNGKEGNNSGNRHKIPGALRAGVTPNVAAEFANVAKNPKKLKATHRVLKVWPRTEEDVEKLEGDLELDVRTTPIDYVAVTGGDAELLKTRMGFGTHVSGDKVLPSEVRYSVTYTDMMTTEGPAEPKTVWMPVYYIVWPVGKPYPASMEWEVLWEVFLPNAEEVVKQRKRNYDEAISKAKMAPSRQRQLLDARDNMGLGRTVIEELSLTAEAFQALEMEAIELALRHTPTPGKTDNPNKGKGNNSGNGNDKYSTQKLVGVVGGIHDGVGRPQIEGMIDIGYRGGAYLDWPSGGNGTTKPPETPPSGPVYTTKPATMRVKGRVEHSDTFLGKTVPVDNLWIEFRLGTKPPHVCVTGMHGEFDSTIDVSSDAQITFIFDG